MHVLQKVSKKMSLNKVILIGYLGRDPEVRSMPNGEAVCNFSLATSESWKNQDGSKTEHTEWHNITLYRKLAEIAGQYLKRGRLVCVEGKIQSRKYTDKTGIERTAYDIIANEMKMLGGKSDVAPVATTNSPPPQVRPNSIPVAPVGDISDDIPF